MNPLSALYGGVVAARNSLFDRGVLRARSLAWPVVSVGNISAGGAGKTPFVIWLGQRLAERGIAFTVLSRGYGRQSRGARVVHASGSAREFGDEPLLIARALECPVIVGESRFAAGRLAEQRFPEARMHLLDDGFQHRALRRDFDLVLASPEDAADALLPVGRLREPLSALRRADALVLPAGCDESPFTSFGKPIWRTARELLLANPPAMPIAFCGIARPAQFFSALRAAGVAPAAEVTFPDHHPYAPADVDALRQRMQASGAGGFITTEKDALNLGPLASGLQPLAVAGLQLAVTGEGDLVDILLATLAERRPCSTT